MKVLPSFLVERGWKLRPPPSPRVAKVDFEKVEIF